MKKTLWGTAVVAAVLLGEGVYAQIRIGAALGGSGAYFEVHAVNDIWLHVVISITILILGVLGIWVTRTVWKWTARPGQNVHRQVLATLHGVPYGMYRPAWLIRSDAQAKFVGIIPFKTLRILSLVPATLVVFCFAMVLGFQFISAYEELRFYDSGELLDVKLVLFPRPVEKNEMNLADFGWIEYASPGQGIALLGGEKARTLIFEDFTIEQHVAESIAAALDKPLERVDQID